jgi:uncharacterized protein (TIGR03435 family)
VKRSALVLVSLALLCAQAPIEFEVASVKVDKNGTGVRGGCHGIDSKYTAGDIGTAPPLGRCVITAGRLSHLIGVAWQLRMDQIKNAPDWVIRGFDRYDIQAEADDPAKTTEAQLRSMLQELLEDRFQLKFHRETVERAGFALTVGERGPRMTATKSEDTSARFGDDVKPTGSSITLNVQKYSMARLAQALSGIRGQPVVDRTGLSGEYDFTLHWDDEQGPTLQTALREQLGLKLEPEKKLPVDLFVIDSAQKPSAN